MMAKIKILRQKNKLNFWERKLEIITPIQIKKRINTLKYVIIEWWKIIVVNKLWRGENKKRIQNPKQDKRKIERGRILNIFMITKWKNMLIKINESMTAIKDSIIINISKVANSLKLCGLKKATTGIKKTTKPEKNSFKKYRKKFFLTFNWNFSTYKSKTITKFNLIKKNYFFIYLDFKFLKIFIIDRRVRH